MARIVQDIHILGLKREIEEEVGGKVDFHESEDAPSDVTEPFYESVLEYERVPWTTHMDQLALEGLHLPPTDEVSDAALGPLLQRVIDTLAGLRVFLSCTNHLSDRELYQELYETALREQTRVLPARLTGAWHIDLIGTGSEEHIELWMTYYADADTRSHWLEQFPDSDRPPGDGLSVQRGLLGHCPGCYRRSDSLPHEDATGRQILQAS